jgi:hypothetical protein
LLLFSLACPGTVDVGDGGGGGGDMAVIDGSGGGEGDLRLTGPNRCTGPGCIGGNCNEDKDCTEGKTGAPKICWKNLLGRRDAIETPGGYCTQECTSSADCGTGYCFQPFGEPKKYCMALCRGPQSCLNDKGMPRPGYVCTFESGAGMDGICYPDGNFNCDPTRDDGRCRGVINADGVTAPGACIRAAFEPRGICRVACKVGVGTCPPNYRLTKTNPPPQHCVFLDTTVDSVGRPSMYGDKWKGGVCLDVIPPQTQPGKPCAYWDECTDGHQCDLYASRPQDKVCRRLCVQGTGMQDPTLYEPPGAMVFGNMCGSPMEACANALQAGAQSGQPGLCTPK